MRRGELTQMDLAWLDKDDNPATCDWGVGSEDVYGTIALINFAELTCKIALTHDFTTWHPIDRIEQLRKIGWARRAFSVSTHAPLIAAICLEKGFRERNLRVATRQVELAGQGLVQANGSSNEGRES